MTPFQTFRLWLRRAPLPERAAASLACVLALALLVWVLVPSSPSGQEGLVSSGEQALSEATVPGEGGAAEAVTDGPTSGETATGSTDATGSTGRTPATFSGTPGGAMTGPGGTTTGGVTGAGGGAPAARGGAEPAPPDGAGSTSCPRGSAPGVSNSEIKIAIILVQIVGPAANSVFGIATPEQQRGYWKKIIADLNAKGGAGCRKLVPSYYEGNPADRNSLQQLCLEIADSGAFAVLDSGAYADYPVVECYPRNKIPYFGAFLVYESVRERSYPYLFQLASADQILKNTVFALRDRGFFKKENGFTKLAFPYRTCDPAVIKKMRAWLGVAGVSASQMVEYDFGCPNALASPSDIQQAVLTFQRAGATHLTYAGFVGDFGNFTKVAEQQRFRPKYGLPNDSLIPLSKGSGAPDPNNVANAIAIAVSADGEETTPGSKPSASTARCNQVLGADVYKLAAVAGKACALAAMFEAAVDNAPTMTRTALAPGLQRAGRVDLSFPQGPNDFSAEGTTTGGQFWRPAQFATSCRCWQVVDRAYKPSYE